MFGGNAQRFVGAVDPKERRIVLLGKTGVGKSAAGNTILGREAFKSALSPTSLTTDCNKVKGWVAGRPVAVIDTPSLFDTNLTNDKVQSKINGCISLSAPGPHAFLVVLQLGRFTQEEKETIKMIQIKFGKEAARYTMVLFTYGDRLKKDETIERFLSESPDLEAFIQSCSGRYHVFNNKVKDLTQTSQLLEKIDKMTTANGGGYYTNDMFLRREYEEPAARSNKLFAVSTIAMAMTGAALGALGGPIGFAVGGAVGALIGVITVAVSKK